MLTNETGGATERLKYKLYTTKQPDGQSCVPIEWAFANSSVQACDHDDSGQCNACSYPLVFSSLAWPLEMDEKTSLV